MNFDKVDKHSALWWLFSSLALSMTNTTTQSVNVFLLCLASQFVVLLYYNIVKILTL